MELEHVMILSGIKCDKCGRTEVIPFENEEMTKILFVSKSWKLKKDSSLCPLCAMKELMK